MDKWEDTKGFIKQMSKDPMEIIENSMKKSPDSVKYVKEEGGNKEFWEVSFKKNGYECFVQYQRGNKEIYRIIAFDNDLNKAFMRQPLLEKDYIDTQLGL